MIAAGDIGRCDSTADDATGALAATLPGVVATLGDTAYEDGTTQELEECFGGSWGGVKDRIRFAVTGNHDIHTDGGAPLQAYMGDAAARDGLTWFSDDLGAWHVVVLDSNCGWLGDLCGSESDQVRWLREDLAASGARCTIALIHVPRFSSGQHGDAHAVGSIWDELYAANAELVLAGHDHDYERFAPQVPDGTPDEARGIVQFVVGTGGADLESFRQARPNSAVRIDDAHGVLELTLRADSWSSRFVDTAGMARDAGGGDCH
jgi:alkaline phosphatase